jgi:hypothetical protein
MRSVFFNNYHARRRLYRPQPPNSDRGSNVWNRRFSGSFALHLTLAVGAVGILSSFTDGL